MRDIKKLAVNLIIANNNTPEQYFVKIENDKGKSIKIGTKTERDDGLLCIRISITDILTHKDI